MGAPAGTGPVVLVGCGRLGSAILEGWLTTGAVAATDLIILTPSDKPAAEAARALGARVNPPLAALADARTLVTAVKPAKWREALAPLAGALNADSVIVSVMAGVAAAEISTLTGRPTARVMPTTAVAQGRGVAGLWCEHDLARERARALFSVMAEVVDLDQEADIDVATATAGSAPAFIHAFVQALARAGEAEGLSGDAAIRLARGALRSAGAGIETGESLDTLIGRIASPGGSTRAGLDALDRDGRLTTALQDTVAAAVRRNREMG